jgi:hypothetical protein
MQLPSEFRVEQSTRYRLGFVWGPRNRVAAYFQVASIAARGARRSARARLLFHSSLILALATTMATACLGQEYMPPPGAIGVGPGPGFSPPLDQQPGPGPAFSPPPNQQPGPGFSPSLDQQPGPGAPVVEPGFWPPLGAAAAAEQPSVTARPGPDSQGKSNDAWLPDDMIGFGGMGGMEGFRGGMNPSDSVR